MDTVAPPPALDHRALYRLPWSMTDNAISWMEPTALCNLACDGCYRKNEKNSHKSMEVVTQELDTFQRLRNSDCISIAGGDPLLHPEIVSIVREVKRRGLKPVINTNGKALTAELLHRLKVAGAFGFTFHVDSKQGRKGEWNGKNELELNALRLQYATMVAAEGGMSCSFNSTIYEDTLQYMPAMARWAQEHIDIVHTMVFIAFRHVTPELPFDWYAGGQKVDYTDIWYHSDTKRTIDISAQRMVETMREGDPTFAPCAYLNGTEKPDSFKWLMHVRVGTKDRIYGYVGPRFMEAVMAGHHLLSGRYLSYTAPRDLKRGKAAMLLSAVDKGMRTAAGRYMGAVARNPFRLFEPLYMQTIMFIQPVDFMPTGEQSMCDGCPDMTVWNGQLVWSCRLEELKTYNTFLRSVVKD
jgi:MoaA/NifB/PqqE/SkfB family radical SAM enzyme